MSGRARRGRSASSRRKTDGSMSDDGSSTCRIPFFFSSRRRHTRYWRDWSSDVCSSDLCEIKNLNSIRFIGQAIEYEARRQIDILEDGGEIEQETRLFDPGRGETRSMRNKEEAHDYRYFPDPDLLPLELTREYVEALARELPELPDEKKMRFIRDYGLSAYDADVLVGERATADF